MQFIKRSFVIFSLVVLSLVIAPFHVYAAGEEVDYDDVIEGVYYSNGSASPVVITWVFNQPVIGYFEPQIRYKTSSNSSVASKTPTVYVNGTTAQYLMSAIDESAIMIQSVTNTFDMLNSAQYEERWTFPLESMNFIVECAGKGYAITEFYNLGQYEIPMYTVPANNELISRALTDSSGDNPYFIIVMWVNKNISSPNSFGTYFTVGNGVVDSVESVMNLRYGGSNTRIIKVKISRGNSTSNTTLTTTQQLLVMPIYNRRSSEMGYETQDFCDLFGLPYNGLSAEQEQSASDLQNEQSEFSQSADDLFQYEDDFNDAMNDSLDEINVNFNVGNQLGSKFLASADWVRSQFNTLTNNTPFGTVLSFSLILGIALLLIGKAVR